MSKLSKSSAKSSPETSPETSAKPLTKTLIYTHPNSIMVGLVKSYLESHSIATRTKNEILSGGMGELAPIDCWQELHVLRDSDHARAVELVQVFKQQDTSHQREHEKGQQESDWTCKNCGEINGKNFELCWQCGRDNFSSYHERP